MYQPNINPTTTNKQYYHSYQLNIIILLQLTCLYIHTINQHEHPLPITTTQELLLVLRMLVHQPFQTYQPSSTSTTVMISVCALRSGLVLCSLSFFFFVFVLSSVLILLCRVFRRRCPWQSCVYIMWGSAELCVSYINVLNADCIVSLTLLIVILMFV